LAALGGTKSAPKVRMTGWWNSCQDREHAATVPARFYPAFPSPPPGWKGRAEGSPPPSPAVPSTRWR